MPVNPWQDWRRSETVPKQFPRLTRRRGEPGNALAWGDRLNKDREVDSGQVQTQSDRTPRMHF
jgi:hypothetical protein